MNRIILVGSKNRVIYRILVGYDPKISWGIDDPTNSDMIQTTIVISTRISIMLYIYIYIHIDIIISPISPHRIQPLCSGNLTLSWGPHPVEYTVRHIHLLVNERFHPEKKKHKNYPGI